MSETAKPKKLIQRQASLKGWRTQKRMAKVRKEHQKEKMEIQKNEDSYFAAYMRRALPNPFG